MNFGEKLINLRKDKKMTQEEVADKLNVTRQTVSNWELNQTKPDVEQLKGLSKLYKISVDDLIDNDVKEVLVEKISNTEKLSGLVYKVLKALVILFVAYLVGIVLLAIFGIALFGLREGVTTVEATTTMNCSLDYEHYTIEVKSNGSNEIIELNGSESLINKLNLEDYRFPNQVFDKVAAYIEENGGKCN